MITPDRARVIRKIRELVASSAALVFATAACAPMHMGTLQPTSVEVPAEGISLPMQDVGGRPIVDVMIGEKGPYPFILDTGASMSCVDEALNVELALSPLPGIHARPIDGGRAPVIVSVLELRIGGAVLRGVPAVVLSLRGLLKTDRPPRGVLSAAVFPGHLVTYDYPARRISIAKGEIAQADGQTTFDYPDGPIPTVPIRVGGRSVRVQLDTGSATTLTLPRRYLKEWALTSSARASGTTRTPAGEFAVLKAAFHGATTIGKHSLDLEELSFSDVRGGNDAPRGQIGYGVLRRFVVTLDSRNQRVRFVRP